MSKSGTHQTIHRVGGAHRLQRLRAALLSAVLIAAALAACGHDDPTPAANEPAAETPDGDLGAEPPGSDDEPGVFGELGRVCGPADGDITASGARGVTDDEIRIGVLNDAGNTLSPGLGGLFVEVADAFADWCNEAGGINGRQLVIVDRDGKLFEAASVVLDACQSDFMLVGGGAALDAPITEPRLDCDLGAIPALNPSYDGQTSDLQAVIGRTSETESNWGLFRLLHEEFHDAFDKIGIVSIDTPDVRIAYERFQRALEGQGLSITSFQAGPPSLDNIRTYIQPLVGRSEALVLPISLVEVFRAINDVGYEPEVIVDQGGIFYGLDTVESLREVPLSAPLYTASTTFPLDRASENSTVAKLVELEEAAFGRADPGHVMPWITWLLFAASASACDELTVDCVIDNATADSAYTAGGLMAPIDLTDPTQLNRCVAISRVSGDGLVYDEERTQPTDSLFNCDPKNIVANG